MTDVVAKLLQVYPNASRDSNNNESTLPLHLTTKWDAHEQPNGMPIKKQRYHF
jgi:hypothetical protein